MVVLAGVGVAWGRAVTVGWGEGSSTCAGTGVTVGRGVGDGGGVGAVQPTAEPAR